MLETHELAYALAAFFFSAFLKGITGLGFSTICLGLLASVIDLKVAIPLAIVPSLSSNVLVMVDAGRFRDALARFWRVYLCSVPGIVLGLWVLDSVESTTARAVLGAVLLAYGLWGLANPGFALSRRQEGWLCAPVGFVTGLVNGVTGSQVMPVLPYLLSLGLDKNLFVQSINVSFTLSSLVMLAGLGQIGLLSTGIVLSSAIGIVPVAAGIWLGGRIRRRLPEAVFKRLVLVFLVALGGWLAVRI